MAILVLKAEDTFITNNNNTLNWKPKNVYKITINKKFSKQMNSSNKN